MEKNSSPTPHLSMEEHWSEHPAIHWLTQHSKQLGYGILVIMLLMITGYRFLASRGAQAEQDFFQAPKAVSDLANPEKTGAALTELDAILKRHPELNAEYDGIIAQQLISDNQLTSAEPYITRTFQRVKNETPADSLDYAKTSLVITASKYQEALAQAYALKEKMLAAVKATPAIQPDATLFAFNVIRIALLEKQLGHKAEERKAWDELTSLSKGTHVIKISPLEIQRITTHFEDQGAKLKEFID